MMTMKKKKLVRETSGYFKNRFGKNPDHIFLSPGRINIIGEHVDYNDGFVLPAAINKYICFAVCENGTTTCNLVAKDLNDSYTFDWNDDLRPVEKTWANYILGVASQLKAVGLPLGGFDLVLSSTIPMGAGLSSSAALECGIGYILNELFGLGLDREKIALAGQKAEHDFVGVKCGIMDQFASVFGKKKHVIELDCTSLAYEYHKADFKKYALLLLDSKVKHTHLTSGYNTRREEVEKGLAIIKAHFPQVTSFRNCTQDMVLQLSAELGDPIMRRCHFVVKEIKRVKDAADALESEDFIGLGKLMYETHQGLSTEYEISCPELDFLVDATRNETAIIGSRMMGGGFGGCSINLVEKGSEKALIEKIGRKYHERFGIGLVAYKVKISNGTSIYKNHHERIQ